MFGGMDAVTRQRVLMRHLEHGWNRIPFGWSTVYPRFPQWAFDFSADRELYRALLRECRAAGIAPVPVIPFLANDSPKAHCARVKEYLAPLADDGEFDQVQWGWEINDINDWACDGDAQLEYVKSLRTWLPISIGLSAHWTPERWSGWPSFHNTIGRAEDELGEFEWLQVAHQYGLTAVNYQLIWDAPLRIGDPRDGDGQLDRYLDYDKKQYDSPGIRGRVQTAGLISRCFEHSRTPDRWATVVASVKEEYQ